MTQENALTSFIRGSEDADKARKDIASVLSCIASFLDRTTITRHSRRVCVNVIRRSTVGDVVVQRESDGTMGLWFADGADYAVCIAMFHIDGSGKVTCTADLTIEALPRVLPAMPEVVLAFRDMLPRFDELCVRLVKISARV